MKLMLPFTFLVSVCLPLFADTIVLKSGQSFDIPGSFEVRGAYVVYMSDDGDLMQLPLKSVDVDRSHQVTADRKAAAEANAAAAAAAEATRKQDEAKVKSMSDVANVIETGRTEDEPAPSELEITSNSVSKFARENPSAGNDSQSGGRVEVRSASEYQNDVGEYNRAYKAAVDEAEDIDREIDKTQKMIRALQNENAFGDNPTSTLYDSAEQLEERLRKLQDQKKDKDAEVSRLQREAKAAGVKDLKRNRKRQSFAEDDDDPDTYRSQDGEFEYQPEDDQ